MSAIPSRARVCLLWFSACAAGRVRQAERSELVVRVRIVRRRSWQGRALHEHALAKTTNQKHQHSYTMMQCLGGLSLGKTSTLLATSSLCLTLPFPKDRTHKILKKRASLIFNSISFVFLDIRYLSQRKPVQYQLFRRRVHSPI